MVCQSVAFVVQNTSVHEEIVQIPLHEGGQLVVMLFYTLQCVLVVQQELANVHAEHVVHELDLVALLFESTQDQQFFGSFVLNHPKLVKIAVGFDHVFIDFLVFFLLDFVFKLLVDILLEVDGFLNCFQTAFILCDDLRIVFVNVLQVDACGCENRLFLVLVENLEFLFVACGPVIKDNTVFAYVQHEEFVFVDHHALGVEFNVDVELRQHWCHFLHPEAALDQTAHRMEVV
mmetsp:Transcript_102946/g.222261  ORF Transcript_102946/g.222261 Transcript_102946/m.222261 type:complete len:232 (+) Transcript_102946:708-1403(+)